MADGHGNDPTNQAPAAGQPTPDRVRGIFARIASRYDLFNMLSSFGLDRLWRRRVARMSGAGANDDVLDIAAGTGDLALTVAHLQQPKTIVASDFVPEMLEVAERKFERYDGPTKLSIAVADAQALPFAEDAFNVATVAFGVRNFPDRAANFREVHRVLRPGGRYLVLEFSRPPSAIFRVLYHFYLRTVIPALGGLLTGDKPSFDYLNESILAFPRQEVLAEEMRSAGFSDVRWRNLTFGVVAVHVATK